MQGMLIQWCQCLAISMATCKLSLPLLSKLRQPIRSTGPASHFTKSGTPTAAGAVFIPVACAVALAHATTPRLLLACAVTLAASIVGLLDDFFTVNPRSIECRGLSATEQLLIQGLSGLILAAASVHFMPQHLISCTGHGTVTAVQLHIAPWLSLAVPPIMYKLLCAFTYISEVNAVNLTDGLDGLAASCTALVLSGTGIGLHGAACPDLQALCACLSGAVCGFYVLNRHPAAAFMGNCGSHGLGAAVAAVAALGGVHGWVAWLSAVLALEAGSTALQLGWYAWTQRHRGEGRRLLRMAPLHHHLEMCGWHEVAVVSLATAAQIALVTIAVALR